MKNKNQPRLDDLTPDEMYIRYLAYGLPNNIPLCYLMVRPGSGDIIFDRHAYYSEIAQKWILKNWENIKCDSTVVHYYGDGAFVIVVKYLGTITKFDIVDGEGAHLFSNYRTNELTMSEKVRLQFYKFTRGISSVFRRVIDDLFV